MKRPVDFLREVETEYPLTSVTVDGVQVWPFLRQLFFWHLWRGELGVRRRKRVQVTRELTRVWNLAYGLHNWWARHDYVFLSSPLFRRQLDGKYVDKHTEWLMARLGRGKCLSVQNSICPGGADFRRTLNGEEKAVSCDPLNLLAVLPFRTSLMRVQNASVLGDINARYGLDVDYCWAIGAFFRTSNAFGRCYRRWRPRMVFVSCYYNLVHQAAVFAANLLGIPVVEFQHGRINETHSGYNIFCRFDRACFPTHMFCYGDYVRDFFGSDNFFMPRENVLPVGNGYIEYIRDRCDAEPDLLKALQVHRKTVAVTSIASLEKAMVDFVRTAAAQDDSILYVFIPRQWSELHSDLQFPKNVIMFKELDFYRIAKYTDFHTTIHSTTALEAPAFGTPNVLINLNGLARAFLSDLLTDTEVTRIVDTPAELVRTVQTWKPKERTEITRRHARFYKMGHAEAGWAAVGKILAESE